MSASSSPLSDFPVPQGVGGQEAGVTTLYTTTVLGDPLAWQGTVINEFTVMTIPGAWRAIDFLASTLAQLPKHVYRRQPNRLLGATPDHALEPILNDEVNNLNTPFTFWQTLYHHAIDWGNGYASISRTPGGAVTALYNLPPDRVIPFRYQGQQWYSVVIDGYDQPIAVPSWQILHIPGLGFDGMKGYPIVQLMVNALRIGKSAELFGGKFFTNGATGIGSIETDALLTKEQIATLKDAIHQQHVGLDNAHQWIILGKGTKATPFPINNSQAQFLETRKFSLGDIARIFGVPPHILYDMGEQKWANISAMQSDLVKNSLAKWIIPSEQEIRRKLFTAPEKSQGYYVKFSIDALQRGDVPTQIEISGKRLAAGITTINEERGIYELPPIGPAGDVHTVAANFQAASRLLDTTPLILPGGPDLPAKTAETDPDDEPAEDPGEFAKKPVTLATFAGLIADAAHRVHRKTEKAVANAMAKHDQGKAEGWIPFANYFAEDQALYTATAVTPILSTFAAVAGIEMDSGHHGKQIGGQYAGALKAHLYAIAKSEATQVPDLTKIISTYGATQWKNRM